MAFKLKGWSAFTKKTDYIKSDHVKDTKEIDLTKRQDVTKHVKGTKAHKAANASKSKAGKKVAKKIAKKVGTRLIPGLGTIALGADIVKEVKSGGAGIKKNIKDVKNFFSSE